MTTKVKKQDFIKRYLVWLEKHLTEVLPPEASEYRMVEITRRQHHHDVNHFVKLIEGDNHGNQNGVS